MVISNSQNILNPKPEGVVVHKSLNLVSSKKLSQLQMRVFKDNKIKLSCFELLFSMCRVKKIQDKTSLIDKAYKKLQIKFDWMNLLKFQNEMEIIKQIVLSEEQNMILSVCKVNKASQANVNASLI